MRNNFQIAKKPEYLRVVESLSAGTVCAGRCPNMCEGNGRTGGQNKPGAPQLCQASQAAAASHQPLAAGDSSSDLAAERFDWESHGCVKYILHSLVNTFINISALCSHHSAGNLRFCRLRNIFFLKFQI